MNYRDWLRSVIGWDGALPLLVAASPAMLPAIVANRDLAELAAVFLVPVAAALLRADRAHRQLASRGIAATLGRQCLLGCAIAALLIFEILTGVLHCAQGAPPAAWLTVAAIYIVYLAFVIPALRPHQMADA